MLINRSLLPVIMSKIGLGKAIIILGPRQSGKSTMLKTFAQLIDRPSIFIDCDEPDYRALLTNATSTALKALIGPATLVLIDEAQRVKNIGLTLKIFTDQLPHAQLIVTGSSAFDLANEINEPLTGRKFEYQMLPLSTAEMVAHHGAIIEQRLLPTRLVFGLYPEVIQNPDVALETIRNMAGSYLYKDIFTFQDIRKPEILETLLKALALQVGSEVSFYELARTVGTDQSTVQRYIQLLEKAFVVFRLPSYSRNARRELTKTRKIYFYDNGIRNAIIGNFSPLTGRTDIGALWENYLVSERLKLVLLQKSHTQRYFWRSIDSREIDYLEEVDGTLSAFEFKWDPERSVKLPKLFRDTYPSATFDVIHPDEYLGFLTEIDREL
jgi:uncharacterized protein